MREIDITAECLEFIDKQNDRVSLKFFQLVEIIGEIKVVDSNFLKKLQSTQFYELRIKAGNEYRIVIFAIDHLNFAECTKAICLCGFQKKGTKDYRKAIKQAEKIVENYLKET
ncbi:type II toxin-antitoxin system RelE/ParE family toxin [Mesonia ostreae]|uniref:Type II toxin-antitoxin system RelE/ParE family toxin n=1 Tax=Mesonia ostreae TaxID=861110 RepID=A0ABU2KFA9_9FLAO|nr:type II toxin-antitoxin system RelE/ParE family toxin [Mesonia ostreae]MDT0293397.1 type II toxin-antitoxin system RelE/ParE family toxin [Mesonia ostreae]